jgi:hypothetical protein
LGLLRANWRGGLRCIIWLAGVMFASSRLRKWWLCWCDCSPLLVTGVAS